MTITNQLISEFKNSLIDEEKSRATVSQYIRDVSALKEWLGERAAKKELLREYKEQLQAKYAPASVNTAIASLNSFFEHFKLPELKQEEYRSLLTAAERKPRLYMILQTLVSTGIRISELKFITAEAIERGTAEIDCKGKRRTVLIPQKLCRTLKKYAKKLKIKAGSIFITKNGNPIDRSNLAKELKKLAELARVAKEKVFPHNFRHLFARTFYNAYKDIVRLADILGHSSIDTTRIYTREAV